MRSDATVPNRSDPVREGPVSKIMRLHFFRADSVFLFSEYTAGAARRGVRTGGKKNYRTPNARTETDPGGGCLDSARLETRRRGRRPSSVHENATGRVVTTSRAHAYVPTWSAGTPGTGRCSSWPHGWATGTGPCGSSSRGSSVSLVCIVRPAYRSWPSLVLTARARKRLPPRRAVRLHFGRPRGRRRRRGGGGGGGGGVSNRARPTPAPQWPAAVAAAAAALGRPGARRYGVVVVVVAGGGVTRRQSAAACALRHHRHRRRPRPDRYCGRRRHEAVPHLWW